MGLMDKRKDWKALRVNLYDKDWHLLKDQADREHLPLTTWVRQKLLQLVEGRAFNED